MGALSTRIGPRPRLKPSRCEGARSVGCLTPLAGRAPEGDPVLLSLGADGGAAAPVGTAPAAVYPGLLAAAPVAGGDLADSLLVRVEQPPRQLRHGAEIRHPADGLPGVDAAQEQDLGLVVVPDMGRQLICYN